jgi:hypothetical protein
MRNNRHFGCFVAAGLILLTTVHSASAHTLLGPPKPENSITIGRDRGGYVLQYAVRMLQYKRAGTLLRFTGTCASACTLYLALPSRQTCITRNVAFQFHAPYGAGSNGNRAVQKYMIATYPTWVRSWISNNGGLSSATLSMDYAYASKYMKSCAVQKVALGPSKKRIR